ncbi:MAG: DEAD/DEAH box helicase [Candidatus Tectomicrobia bacterium]|uniref:DNA 3'-5' helicase n=1 Tax=Tectimicrobiota bacterium TaxID=2528274 RepID=A0A937VXW8_UNCTE|nr:DEAD/DEAH box helicase [Candidatus Tectomicrobia bacterium]
MDSASSFQPHNPLIVQSDHTLLLEVHNPLYEAARTAIGAFAELEKSPEHIHTYRITPLSLWNAAAAGLSAERMSTALTEFAKYPVPQNVLVDIRDLAGRWGRVQLVRQDGGLVLASADTALLTELSRHRAIKNYLGEAITPTSFAVPVRYRGVLKQTLTTVGWPVEDLAGYVEGVPLPLDLQTASFAPRDYQAEAARVFYQEGTAVGGSGVVVLPCGAGKTIVGLAVMAQVQQSTLILTTGQTSVAQWRRELLDKTTLQESDIAEYTGAVKDIGPVTLTTYQMLTHRPDKGQEFPHLKLFDQRDWGLIIYDEVHLLPAPVFRVTAEVQARRRLGLTATLVREDGREGDVFSLIGPKKYDVPWRDLEGRGWIAEAVCTEVRCTMPRDVRMSYATALTREKFRIAAENPVKGPLAQQILERHPQAPALIIGQYLEQIQHIARATGAPLITGKTSQRERERLYGLFRTGELSLLVLSKVGNFALDLPDAEVLIQVSGTFGSRQEEAQRLGRVLRPKAVGRQAHFYTLVSRDTDEQDFAHHRQLFLTEQGYTYRITDESEWCS